MKKKPNVENVASEQSLFMYRFMDDGTIAEHKILITLTDASRKLMKKDNKAKAISLTNKKCCNLTVSLDEGVIVGRNIWFRKKNKKEATKLLKSKFA